jgi:hypothetical protein
MRYNLFLNSTTDNPLTNYYSANATANRGQRVYAVDWSFLPENKKYEISFRFASKSGTYTADNLLYVTATIGLLSTTATGSSITARKNNRVLGVLKPRQASPTVNDIQLSALASDNEPLTILSRPADNYLEILIMDATTGLQYNLTTDYVLILTFTEII